MYTETNPDSSNGFIHIYKTSYQLQSIFLMLWDLIMVSHAVWKTWPEGLSRQKPRLKADVFVVTEAIIARSLIEAIIARSLIDFFSLYSQNFEF